jgi:ribosomal protein L40E
LDHDESEIICPVCGGSNDKEGEPCEKCNAEFLEGLHSGNVTIDSESIQRLKQINEKYDIICPACKAHNKPAARNCVQCGAWLLDQSWNTSRADDGYSPRLPSDLKGASFVPSRKGKPFSQSSWSIWLLLVFGLFILMSKMLPANHAGNLPDSNVPAVNGQDEKNLTLADLPPNGDTCYYKNAEAIAPFTIESAPGVNYFIKLIDSDTGSTAVTVFARGGQSVNTKVPLGIYEFRYASGEKWYGENDLFGPQTVFMKANDKLSFKLNGQKIAGYTVTLIKQPDGNLHTQMLNKNQF